MSSATHGLRKSGEGSLLGDGGIRRDKAILKHFGCLCTDAHRWTLKCTREHEDLEELGHKNTEAQDLPKPENLRSHSHWDGMAWCTGNTGRMNEAGSSIRCEPWCWQSMGSEKNTSIIQQREDDASTNITGIVSIPHKRERNLNTSHSAYQDWVNGWVKRAPAASL